MAYVPTVTLYNSDTPFVDPVTLSATDGTIEIDSTYNNYQISGGTYGANVNIDSGVTLAIGGQSSNVWNIGSAAQGYGTNVNVSGTITFTSNVNLSGGSSINVEDGGVVTLGPLNMAAGASVVVNNGGHLILNGVGTTTTGISFGTEGGTIEVASGVSLSILSKITGIKVGDTIIIDGVTSNGISETDDGVYTLTQNGTELQATGRFQPVLANGVEGFTVYTDANGNTILTAVDYSNICFLAGSMVRTPEGDVAVENLRSGDHVVALVNGQNVTREVVWTGVAHAKIKADMPDDMAGYPVRILKNAFAEGVPYKDMLITAEHCLFIDGKMVPARMLVNGSSIFYDRSITDYDYYHVETAEHSVLTVDGMLTESYLDTGNRAAFVSNGNVVSLGRAKSWAEDAAAPLAVSRDAVEPIFAALAQRASSIEGRREETQTYTMTTDHDLHLITNTGAIIRSVREKAGRVSFMLPTGVNSVRLVSRSNRPSDVIGPFVDDRRHLGVLVGEVSVVNADVTHNVTAHTDTENLSGWYPLEGADYRWTNGNAELPLGKAVNGMGMLSIQIVAAGPYFSEQKIEGQSALQA
ncbi:hypothetical protein FOH24_11750 [Acetobacter tropicalis]|nr:Hint domain-containing protein [Acetobacter tropicalis]KAA8385745.1 hypothetical protein FOH22_12835 [Acetobacter tropicalis]KAA8388975.1 hypothetical protein FOH24_11750 [Acetobacter tropicalis]MBC9007505.1 Hint domain-containing protein [Acetobacter tropicalis]MDO8171146.1 Hint domain-containing protein [Acetobacter tropicalis]